MEVHLGVSWDPRTEGNHKGWQEHRNQGFEAAMESSLDRIGQLEDGLCPTVDCRLAKSHDIRSPSPTLHLRGRPLT